MSSISERPTTSSVNSNNMINLNENIKTDISEKIAELNNKKEINYTTSFKKLFSLQKLIQKQANLKDICKKNI